MRRHWGLRDRLNGCRVLLIAAVHFLLEPQLVEDELCKALARRKAARTLKFFDQTLGDPYDEERYD